MQRSAVQYTAALALLAARNACPAAAALLFMAFSDQTRGAPTSHSPAPSHQPELWDDSSRHQGASACLSPFVVHEPISQPSPAQAHSVTLCPSPLLPPLKTHTDAGDGIPSFFVGHIRGI